MEFSVDIITEKLKQFHQDKKNKKELRTYLENIELGKLEDVIEKKLLTSAGLDVIDALFTGLTNTTTGQTKKLKVIRHVLKLLQSSESAAHVSLLVTSVRLELPTLAGNSLKVLAEDCIEAIRNNTDQHTSWKDILPECLRVLGDLSGTVNHCDTEMSGSEYVSQCLKALCLIAWDPTLITPLATMFRDISLSKEDHLQIVKKLCCDLDKLNPDSLPPLLYQLLRLCREQNSTIVFFRFSEYFSSRLYKELLPQDMVQESESPDLDLIGAEHADDSALSAHATCIQFTVGDSCIPRHVIATLKAASRRPSTLLSSPPLLHLLLSAESQRDVCLQIIKSTLTYSLLEKHRRDEFTWCADSLPVQVPLETLIKSLVHSSTKHCQLSTVGLLHLSTCLISSWGNVPLFMLPLPYSQLRALGRLLLVRLGRACPKSIAQGLKLLMHTPQLTTDLLESLCINASPMLMECIPELRSIVEECLSFQHDPSETDAVSWRCRTLQAVVPVTTRASNLRDTFLIMCRKGLFSREPSVGRVAVTGLLSLLRALRCSSDTFSQDFSGSEHTVLTQISIDVHSHNARSRVNNAAVCMEVISQLRVCLYQNWEVREQLYKGLPNVLSKRPELLEPLLELLYEHITLKFIQSEASDNIPLLFDKCVAIRDDSAVLLEPIGTLLFCLQKIIVTDVKDCTSVASAENGLFSNKVAKLLQLCAEKMANKTPTDFGLDDGVWLGDILPESRAKTIIVQQLLLVCEALVAFCVQHWAFLNITTISRTILGLHKTYEQLTAVTFSKDAKNKKNVLLKEKKGKGTKGPMKLNDMRKDHAVVFKQLDTVWDIDMVYKVVQLLYSNDVEWESKEDMTIVRTSRSLHRHFVNSCINSVKVSANLSHTGEIIRVSKMLYSRCISRLDDFSDFDQETALHIVECFQELLSTICSGESNDKLLTFLTEVGGNTEANDLSSRISHMCECISAQVVKTAEGCVDNEDPSTSKIPPALLRTLTTLLSKLPSNMPSCDKWAEWLIQLCSDGVKSKWVGSSVISTILNLSARSRNPWNAVEALVEALTKIMGVSDDTNETTQDEYSGVFSCLAHSSTAVSTTYLLLCSHMNRRLGAVELVVGRLKAELQAVLPFKAAQHQHAIASALKNRERSLCVELTHLINVCKRLALLLCPAGSCCAAAIKLMGRLHSVLAVAVQHFITRDVTFLLNARFDRVVMSAGRRLSKSCDALIEHVEGARKDLKGGRSVVVRDTKHIPKMVYCMEQFAKRVMQLDKKTKLDLMSHFTKGSARDFRIKASSIHDALKKNRNEGEENDRQDEDNEDGAENIGSIDVEMEVQIESDNDATSKGDDSHAEMESEEERPTKKKKMS